MSLGEIRGVDDVWYFLYKNVNYITYSWLEYNIWDDELDEWLRWSAIQWKNINELAWRVYVKARSLILLDIMDLWLSKAANPEYKIRISGIKYGNKSYRYDKGGFVDVGVVEKLKALTSKLDGA